METAVRELASGASPIAYSVEVLTRPDQIAELEDRARPLLAKVPTSSRPRFFLASVTPRKWSPCVVVVRQGEEIRGLVYFKERRVGGIGTGLLYSDATLGAFLAAEPGNQEAIIRQALDALLSRFKFRGLRVRVAPESSMAEVLESVAKHLGQEFNRRPELYHSFALLPDTYQEFLDSLSVNGRRAVRVRRRRFEEAGHHYVESMDAAEFSRVALRLIGRSVVGGEKDSVERALRICNESDRPIRSGLRGRDGEWLAILGGWYEAGHAVWFFQLNNDRDYVTYSLATVLRACFMESMIEQGHRKVFFWAATDGPVARATQPCPSLFISLDRPTVGWRALRTLCDRLAALLPGSSQIAITRVAGRGN